jgi:hypothetical protein
MLRCNLMIESFDSKKMDKPRVRCAMCDEEVTHYNTFFGPKDEQRNVCWKCLEREEKGFFAKRDFTRSARSGRIPR